jgi:hypothetical protein
MRRTEIEHRHGHDRGECQERLALISAFSLPRGSAQCRATMKASHFFHTTLLGFVAICAAAGSAAAQEEFEDPAIVERRNAFLQKNFSKFPPVKFEKDTNGFAKMHLLQMKTNTWSHEGESYTGFRFTIPAWLDGDFDWMFLFAQSEAEKNFHPPAAFRWFIVPRAGKTEGFKGFFPMPLNSYPALQKEFPHSRLVARQQLSRSAVKAGEDYAIWFKFPPTSKIPDIRFAMTISSDRGERESGPLPTR